MVLAVGKGIDWVQGKCDVKPRVRQPLSWDMLWDGKTEILAAEGGRTVMWMGPSLAHFLSLYSLTLCVRQRDGASRLLLGQRDLTFFRRPAAKLGMQAGGRQGQSWFKSVKYEPEGNWGGDDEDPSAAYGKGGWEVSY